MKPSFQTRFATLAFGLLVASLVGVLAVAVCQLPGEPRGLGGEVAERLERAGASNPVTAVLLNFRAYDTLLELVVLLLAVLGAQVLAGDATDLSTAAPIPVLLGFVRVVAPVMVVVTGYILWVGGYAAGGAFQAGALLAALGVLLLMAGLQRRIRGRIRGRFWSVSGVAERCIFVAGLVVFLGVGIGTMLTQRRFLEYPVSEAKWLLLMIEGAATLSIAAILVALFRGGHLLLAKPTTGEIRSENRKERKS